MKTSYFPHFIYIISLTLTPYLISQSDWIQLNSGVTTPLNSIYFINSSTGYAGGNNTVLLKTTNGGTSWNLYNNGIPASWSIIKISFPNIDTGYVLADSNLYLKTYKTTNQGLNWFSLPDRMVDIHFLNGLTGFGAVYNAYKTTNGGLNWSNYSLENGYFTTAIYMINETTGFIAGARTQHPLDKTNISKTINSTTWSTAYMTDGYYTFKMGSFYDLNNGAFITKNVPGSIKIYRIKNGNWTIENIDLYSLDYISANVILSCGPAGVIKKSINGGDTWYNTVSGVTSNLNSIYFPDTLLGFTCGDNGVILKTTNGGGVIGIQTINTNISTSFSLSQNYPNPFNPLTSINFQLPKNSFVQIVIFDVLGNEVETIVNQNLNAGSYKVDWNASKNSSGVYYYRITAGSFVETKKLVLIK